MRKIYSFLSVLLCGLALVSCGGSGSGSSEKSKEVTALEQIVAATKTQVNVPVQLMEGVTWTDMVLENNYVVYIYDVNDELESQLDAESARSTLRMTLNDPNEAEFIKAVDAASYGVKWRYNLTPSGKKKEIECPATMIKEWVKAGPQELAVELNEETKEYFQQQAEAVKAVCPMQADEQTLLVDCNFDGQALNYTYEVSAEMLENLKGMKDQLKESIRKNLEEGNEMAKLMAQRCRESHVSILYHYTVKGSSDNIVISYN